MSIDIRTTDDRQWNDIVSDSPAATPFHRAEALDVLETHANATLHRLAGFKGQEPVGLFPVYEVAKGPATAAVSPPPDLKLPYLGPSLLNTGKLKRRKRDRRHRRFIDAALEWVEREVSPNLWNVRTPVGYDDIRPFQWREYEVSPRYTYVIDLETTPEDLLGRFSSDLRKKVRREYDVSYEVTEEGPAAIDRIVERTRERHEEQGESFPLTAEFVRMLADRLPDGTVRPYVCRIDGEFAGGLIDVEGDERAGAWIANGKTDAPVPVNDLLEWRVCVDGIDRGLSTYDLMGANHERIYSYKAKFAPDLVQYFTVQKGSVGMNAATKLYKKLR
ncbi:GNAT family N-acetyltransferase [Halorarum halobium]|uniref:GNAT family N-acetyltransferase n=1 Tax=Halorarum halobium TaxID=3075121 RepID=UPI0028A89BAB|nr:GNAT family N-acetyltransferase [Halobaculum sp. XH14]